AHADQTDLLEWVSHFESDPRVFVVHGEATASETLAKEIQERFNLIVHVPKLKERLILGPREVAFEKPKVAELLSDVKTMMLNTIIDLENELKMLKKRIKSEEIEEEIVEDDVGRLKYIQEELQAILS
ncbi:unnamed protein product, partial [marine sediment metagenome]